MRRGDDPVGIDSGVPARGLRRPGWQVMSLEHFRKISEELADRRVELMLVLKTDGFFRLSESTLRKLIEASFLDGAAQAYWECSEAGHPGSTEGAECKK